MGLDYLGKALLALGGIVILLGLLMLGLSRLLGGSRLLPGDIVVQRPGFTFVFPIVTSLVVSAVLTLILWLLYAWRR
ncbi:MAG: DUF2905 domain-containing protein [Armatimonadota bacterium]|nr:MAG: DUF2905 domain-containing protein [Armatimonadota bacterium]